MANPVDYCIRGVGYIWSSYVNVFASALKSSVGSVKADRLTTTCIYSLEPLNDANPNLAAPHGPKSVAFREFIAAAP
eukprot:scaffold13691_cov159-Skeletonema_dohrnii-CCMP3373.AAC.2